MSDIQALDSTKITLEEINLKKEELKEINDSIQHYQDIIKFAKAIKALQADENYKLVFNSRKSHSLLNGFFYFCMLSKREPILVKL